MKRIICILTYLSIQLAAIAQQMPAEEYYVQALTPTKNGSYSIIVIGGEHPNGRAVTTGHEVIGHGRSWATGLGDSHQHVQAIRTENLILRVMGIPFINSGINHGREKTPIPCPSLLPAFR